MAQWMHRHCRFSLFPVSRTDFAVSAEVLGGFISERIRSVLPGFVSTEAFESYAKKTAKVTNYAFLVGHCMLRSAVMGVADRKPQLLKRQADARFANIPQVKNSLIYHE